MIRILPRAVLAGALGLAVAAAACRERRRHPDIVLITIDTLRADRLGIYGSRLGLTPHLDQFARGALVFERAYAVAPITAPSLSTAFTSHYPHETKVTDNGLTIPTEIETLAGFLREQGYETAAVVSNPVLTWPNRLDVRFESYDDDLPEREMYREEPTRRAARTTDAALKRWREHGSRPFFLWVHYMDPHGPYEAPGVLLEKADRATPAFDRMLPVSATDRGLGGIPKYQYLPGCFSSRDYVVRHNGAVASLDSELGRLLDSSELASLRTQGLICITADHGEALGEHDTWFAHGENLYQEMLRIPWIVKGRGIRQGRRPDLVSLVDLLPSLQDYLGTKADRSWRGVPVFRGPAQPDRILLAETFPAASAAQRYLAISVPASVILSEPGGWEYYREPKQRENLASGRTEEMHSLARWLRQETLRNDLTLVVPEAPERVLSPEAVRRLRSLGYLQ